MPAVKLIAALLLSSVLVLTGCGATDSGHADSFSANHTDPGADGPNGRESDVAPSITKHPVSVYPYEGEATALSVSAEGTDLSYQWQRAMTNEWVS
ncbi:MAG: hypothetical protein R3208_17140, partial [Ketobacteraceae bacterium]|nr:hypothetical protein [Ketobacteraceae bacterium]